MLARIAIWAWASVLVGAGPGSAPIQEKKTLTYRDVAKAWGVTFSFDQGSRGKHDLPEIMGGGMAIFDADNDGRLDLFFCQGGPLIQDAQNPKADPPCRLFLQKQPRQFEDVTKTANAPGPSYAMGTAVGDFDKDGLLDLFVTGWQDQRLYRNRGQGRFEDVTKSAGLESQLWSTAAAFADLDQDGDLDLYVANYLTFDIRQAPFCSAPDGKRDYCSPEDFPAQPDKLYRNNGDGTFTDISQTAGIQRPDGRGLGVLIADLRGDHKLDILVANDSSAFFLFENQGNLVFKETAHVAGIALDGNGMALSGMGLALADFNQDGHPDVAASNFRNRGSVLFQSLEHGSFADASARSGLLGSTLNVVGFGVAASDLNQDGHLDLVQVNGHVLDRERLGVPYQMAPNLLIRQNGEFEDQLRTAGEAIQRKSLGRGLAVVDLDQDGREEIVISALDAPISILTLESQPSQTLILDLRPQTSPGAGTKVQVDEQTYWISSGGSYLTTVISSRLYIGLGSKTQASRVRIEWPSRVVQTLMNLPARSEPHVIREKSASNEKAP